MEIFYKIFEVEGFQILVSREFEYDEEDEAFYVLAFSVNLSGIKAVMGMKFVTELARDIAFNEVDAGRARSILHKLAGIAK